MRRSLYCFALTGLATTGHAAELTPELAAFRELYADLIAINTTLSVGSCTEAAEFVAGQLRAAGFAADDVTVVVPEEFPRQGNLVAVLRGSEPALEPLLLLAHLDVVEANREDWDRDPFTLIEDDGYFYGRGTVDDKAMAAIFVDALLRYRADDYRPLRDIKIALTCGEETPGTFNGVRYLVENHRELIDAEFAINEAARGRLDAAGNRVLNEVQGGEAVLYTLWYATKEHGHNEKLTDLLFRAICDNYKASTSDPGDAQQRTCLAIRSITDLLMIDGLPVAPFEEALAAHELPHLERLFADRPTLRTRAISTFPSATAPSVPELLSGRWVELDKADLAEAAAALAEQAKAAGDEGINDFSIRSLLVAFVGATILLFAWGVVFLASEQSSYITGTVLNISGGLVTAVADLAVAVLGSARVATTSTRLVWPVSTDSAAPDSTFQIRTVPSSDPDASVPSLRTTSDVTSDECPRNVDSRSPVAMFQTVMLLFDSAAARRPCDQKTRASAWSQRRCRAARPRTPEADGRRGRAALAGHHPPLKPRSRRVRFVTHLMRKFALLFTALALVHQPAERAVAQLLGAGGRVAIGVLSDRLGSRLLRS